MDSAILLEPTSTTQGWVGRAAGQKARSPVQAFLLDATGRPQRVSLHGLSRQPATGCLQRDPGSRLQLRLLQALRAWPSIAAAAWHSVAHEGQTFRAGEPAKHKAKRSGMRQSPPIFWRQQTHTGLFTSRARRTPNHPCSTSGCCRAAASAPSSGPRCAQKSRHSCPRP